MDLVDLALKNEAKVVAVDLVTDSDGYRFLHTNAANGQSVIWSATASVVPQRSIISSNGSLATTRNFNRNPA